MWLARATVGCFLLLVAGHGAPAGARPSDAQARVEEFEVAGIPVLLRRIEANEVIAVKLFIRGGTANLTPRTAGIERFLFAASERGTEKYAKDLWYARLASTGTRVAGAAGYDFSTFSMETVLGSWDEAWDLYTQALLRPTLPPSEVELVRGQILNSVRQRRDDPDAYMRDLADSLFYQGHPYALNPEGTEAAIADISVDDLRAWHDRRLTKDNLLLVVVGNVGRGDLESRVEAALGDLPETGDAGRPVNRAPARSAAVAVVERRLPTNYVRGLFPAPSLGDEEDYAALTAAMEVLSNRLFEEVRTKRNLTYAVFSGLSARLSNYGLLYVTAVQPDSALSVMLAEVRKLRDEPLSEDVLAAAVSVFVTEYYQGLESNEAQASLLGRFELLGGSWKEAEDFV
ncbi:MAG: insulinase family protein, partial [Gemmatimonadetes bacterium]|nr:insulinase family protein [Gemmatimonadota bacterium]